MKLKRVADAYKTSIDGLAKMMGYSRQALYNIVSTGNKNICSARISAAMKNLKQKSDDMYVYDMAKANVEKREREEIIRQLCQKVGTTDVTKKQEGIENEKSYGSRIKNKSDRYIDQSISIANIYKTRLIIAFN